MGKSLLARIPDGIEVGLIRRNGRGIANENGVFKVLRFLLR
jgi:hypothetical protein